MNNPIPYGMGAIPRVVKPIDYHPDSFGKASQTPVSFSTPIPVVYSQLKTPSCGAHMSTQYINILSGSICSPEFTWKNIRHIDGLSPDDGSTSDTLGKEAQKISSCLLTLMSDNADQSNLDYASYSDISDDMIKDASTRLISNYAFIENPTFQQIKDNIYNHKAVGLRVSCGNGWWLPSQLFPLKLGDYVDGHFILANGFDENFIYFVNSWGTNWGNGGTGYFDETYMPYVKELVIYVTEDKQYQFNNNLWFGQTSADVHALQKRLGITPDTGFFGWLTFRAVQAYQSSKGIMPTGFVGPITRNSLNMLS